MKAYRRAYEPARLAESQPAAHAPERATEPRARVIVPSDVSQPGADAATGAAATVKVKARVGVARASATSAM